MIIQKYGAFMKILSYILGLFLVIVIGAYTVLFTSFGNSLVQPSIEAKIQEQTKLPSKLKTFTLSMSAFEILLEINPNNTLHLKGTYSPFAQSFDLTYNVKLEELSSLEPLTQTPLQSSFHTDGKVVGDMDYLEVDGKSDLAKSNTTYHVELTEFNPTSIIAKIDTLDLNALLFMLKQKAYASAKVNLDVNFKDIAPHKLDGEVSLITQEGKLNTKVMKKDFGISIPKTAFSMKLLAKLKGDDVNYTYFLTSNLAKLSSSGVVTPEPLKIDVKYGVDVKELAVLKPMTGADIRGPLRLSGTAKGEKERLVVDGKTNIAESKTTFVAILKDFQASSVKANIKALKLQKVLYMVKQPHYADGLFDLDVDITNADPKNLQGTINSRISKGLVDSKFVTKEYEFKSQMPRTTFNTKTYTTLKKNMVSTKLDFNSNLANFDIKDAKFNLDDGSLHSDYVVSIKDLNRLYFATDRHLKGAIVAHGNLDKTKDLDLTMKSDVADGKLDVTLHNDDLVANIFAMQTLKVLEMLLYPEVFKSKVDGKFVYNLATQKGTFSGKLNEGTFTNNQVLNLVKQYANINLYKQRFLGDVDAKLNKEKVVVDFNLKSNTSSIQTKNTKLNTKTQHIDSKIDISANGNPLSVALKGNVNNPKIKVDASKIVKKQAEKAVKKEINKLFKGLF
jgi:hypothetical protein